MSIHILVADDEKELADVLEVYLANDGYTVHKCCIGAEALDCIEHTALDLAILDVMLPDVDGFQICRKIREKSFYPVIMLTAKAADRDRILGLTIGADDYITKPFNPLEVVARVKTQLRRYTLYNGSAPRPEDPAREYDIRGLVISRDSHKCFLFGKELQLTPHEFSILWYLCERQGAVVPSEELFEAVWGEKYLKNNNTVMAHIGRLREKLGEPARSPRFIKTVWGLATPLRNKNDFLPLRRKVFLRTIAVPAAAAAVLYLTYAVLLRGRFVGGMVALFQNTLGLGYDAALRLYERTFRSHMDAIILLSILVVFAGLLCVYLRWLTRYFASISVGMDILLQDTPGEVSLPPELLPIERKMNLVKRAIGRQKSDMLLAEQRKNDLIMYLAHDLKTPLASSISYLNLLRDEKQLSEELREKYLSISLAKSERLKDLINEFLEIARYSLSTITLQYSEINLTRLLEQLVYEFQPVLDQKSLTCRLMAGDDILLNCDADKMQRVFDNLLRNAVNYSSSGTEITIEAENGEDSVTLLFTNRGGTIPREKLERIFEQFYRLDTRRSSSGAGLGLAIARQIVTLHKGTITAESGNGLTVFTVTLPILR